MSVHYPESSERLATPAQIIPARLLRFLRRVMALPPGHAYAVTLWIPESDDSEPVWTVNPLGKIENDR